MEMRFPERIRWTAGENRQSLVREVAERSRPSEEAGPYALELDKLLKSREGFRRDPVILSSSSVICHVSCRVS